MAPKSTISQLDLVLLGRRGLTARLGSMESQVKRLTTGSGGDGAEVTAQELRPNLLTNSSFEFYDRGSTKPQDWAITGAALVSVGSAGADGTNTLRLPASASVTQAAAASVVVPQSSIVISAAARTDYASQKIAIGITHTPGYQAGPMMRLDVTGGLLQTDDVPNDGNWYRFYRQFILTGGATVSAVLAQAGSGTLEVDAVKLEKEDGVASWLEPTAYMSADWGAATHIRNLAAENIVTGTLVVGGSISTNPRISVKDGSDVEIITIGQPTGGYYGVEIKGAAGFRISGSGSAEVLGGGSVKVKGGGDITVDGGNIAITNGGLSVSGTGGVTVSGGGSVTIGNTGSLIITGTGGIAVSGGGNITVGNTGSVLVTGTGVIRAGTAGAQRVDILASGLSLFNASNVETVRADAADGKLKVLGAGGLTVSGSGGILVSGGGGITVDNSGLIILTGTGIVRAGPSTGYHAELGAGGLALFGSTGSQTILMSSITGKVHVFDDSLQIENGGKLTYVSGLVWSDNQGFWAMDASGNAAFGVSGVDGKVWGNLPGAVPLDKGDILIGRNSNYVLWDASAGVVKFSGDGAGITSINGGNITAGTITALGTVTSGSIVIGSTNKLWFNDSNDGALNIGGTVKASAPFRVSSAGALVATNAALTGTFTAGIVSVNQTTGIGISVATSGTNTATEGIQWLASGIRKAKIFAYNHTTGGGQVFFETDNVTGGIYINGSAFTWAAGYGGLYGEARIDFLRVGTNPTLAPQGSISAAGNFYPGGAADCYFGRYGASTPYISGNVVIGGGLYPGNQGSYYINYWSSGGHITNGHFVAGGNFYPNNQGSYYLQYNTNNGYNSIYTNGSLNAGGAVISNNFFRSIGSTGWYNETYGGGIYMIDSGFIRTYGSKNFYCDQKVQAATMQSDGNMGVGTAPGGINRLLVLGIDSTASNNAGAFRNSGNSDLVYFRNDGVVWANRNWTIGSDRRLKDDIAPLELGLDAVLQLQPSRYRRKLGGHIEYGLIAQEVREVLPELVTEGADGILGVEYNGIIPMLVNAVRELKVEIEELKSSR